MVLPCGYSSITAPPHGPVRSALMADPFGDDDHDPFDGMMEALIPDESDSNFLV